MHSQRLTHYSFMPFGATPAINLLVPGIYLANERL
jgi:hypothetical protein